METLHSQSASPPRGLQMGTSELLGKLNEMQEGDPRWSGIPVQANYSLGRLNWAIETRQSKPQHDEPATS